MGRRKYLVIPPRTVEAVTLYIFLSFVVFLEFFFKKSKIAFKIKLGFTRVHVYPAEKLTLKLTAEMKGGAKTAGMLRAFLSNL